MQIEYDLNDIIEMKKEHPCHKSKLWKIIRVGIDIKVECQGCGAIIMFDRTVFDKKIKKVVKHVEQD